MELTYYFFYFFLFSPLLAIHCPLGFSDLNNRTCFKYFDEPLTYYNATEHCKQLGAKLISIQNSFENRLLTNHISSYTFISLEKWNNRDKAYTNYHSENQENDGNCVYLETDTGYWKNISCNETNNYICEAVEKCENVYQDNCYRPYSFTLSEQEAENVCEQTCGHLVSIHSSDENSFVKNLFDAKTVPYLRLGAVYQNNKIGWIDNSSMTYQNVGYQNVNFGLCYSMALTNEVVQAGKWISSQCQKLLPFVCKIPIDTVCGKQCNGTEFLDNEGYIYSPNYPMPYTFFNQSCTYIFDTPVDTFTFIEFTDFVVDPTAKIELYNSIEDEEPFVIFDNSNIPKGKYYSTSNTMKLSFHSTSSYYDDNSFRWSAFFSSSQVLPTQPLISSCGYLRFYNAPTYIFYPYGEGSLPFFDHCIYNISTARTNKIKISFDYYLEKGSSITMYDGTTFDSPVLGTIESGNRSSTSYTSSSYHMLVYLNTTSIQDYFASDVRSW